MKFVLMIFHGTTPLPGTPAWDALGKEEQGRIYAEYQALNQTPGLEQGLPLGHKTAARTVTVVNGKPQVAIGPYQEGAGGFAILEADTIEQAIEVAAKVPAARLGGAVEVRPAEKYW
ncbi:MAG TPA: YciI family protein [Kofleriaceae bacterium]|jgi:hypothetical protein